MTKKKTELAEFDTSAGNGAKANDPVNTGNAHANRKADKNTAPEAMPTLETKDGPSQKYETITWALKNMGDSDVMAQFMKIKNEWEKNLERKAAGTTASKSIVTKEDVEALFGGHELSEDFKAQASVLFEAAVGAQLVEKVAELEEEFAGKLDEAVEAFKTETTDKIDAYLNYVAEQYLEDNKLAIQAGLRTEMSESLMAGLKQVFETHYIDIPEDKVDVVESLTDEVEALKAKLDEEIGKSIELVQKIEEANKVAALVTMSEGLTETQKEKFKKLVEGVESSDLADFESKAKIIKEAHFIAGSKAKVLVEDSLNSGEPIATPDEKKAVSADPEIAAIAAAMKRSAIR